MCTGHTARRNPQERTGEADETQSAIGCPRERCVLAAGAPAPPRRSTRFHAEKASAQEHKAYAPHINPSEFSTSIDNEYLPMKPGTTFVYREAQSATR